MKDPWPDTEPAQFEQDKEGRTAMPNKEWSGFDEQTTCPHGLRWEEDCEDCDQEQEELGKDYAQ